jgi:hypothetical protein
VSATNAAKATWVVGEAPAADGVRVRECVAEPWSSEVEYRVVELDRGKQQIGSVDFWFCRICRWVLLGKISLVDTGQGEGLGSRVLALLRTNLTGYRWSTTVQGRAAAGFWRRMQRAYPGEYFDGGDERGRTCAHIGDAL